MCTWIQLAVLALAAALPRQVESPDDAAVKVEPAPPGLLLVLHKSENSLGLYDPATGERVLTAPTGMGPHEAAVSPDGRLAVVCDYGHAEPGNTLTVFDLEARKVVRTIDLGEYRRPHGVVFSGAGGRQVLVTAEANRALVRVDVERGYVVEAIDTDQDVSHMVAATPDGGRAFVANIGSGSISAIDLSLGTLIRVIPTGAGAEGLDVTPSGSHVWVGNREADSLTVIDARSLEVVRTIPCGEFPIRVKSTPDGKHVLVSNARSAEVAVFDAATGEERARVAMEVKANEDSEGRLFGSRFEGSPVPIGLLFDPEGRRAYVANTYADAVTVIDLESMRVIGRIATGREPDGMAWCPPLETATAGSSEGAR